MFLKLHFYLCQFILLIDSCVSWREMVKSITTTVSTIRKRFATLISCERTKTSASSKR